MKHFYFQFKTISNLSRRICPESIKVSLKYSTGWKFLKFKRV